MVAGAEEGAGSNTLDPGAAAGRARVAFREHPELAAATFDFIERVEDAAGTTPATAPPPEPPPGQEDSGGNTVLLVLLAVAGVVALGVGLALTLENRSQQRTLRSGAQLAEAKATAQEDLDALADDLRNLNVDLQAEEAGNPEAVNQYTRAYEYLERAEEAFDRARSPADLAQVSSALESGQYAMAAARALFEGRDPPRRRPPCFFDTRHGPSVHDVGWEPPGGPPRPVPACRACMQQVANGVQPQPRRIRTGLRRVPFYDAPPHFESWFGGYFGGAAADLVAGFPLGKALDDGFAGAATPPAAATATCPSRSPTRAYSTVVVLSRESRRRTAARSPSRRTPMRTSRPAHGSRPAARRWLGSILLALVGGHPDRRTGGGGRLGRSVAAALSRSRVYRGPGRRDAGLDRPAPGAVDDAGTPSSSPSCPPTPAARPAAAYRAGQGDRPRRRQARHLHGRLRHAVRHAATSATPCPTARPRRWPTRPSTTTGTTRRRPCSSGSTRWPRPPGANPPPSPAATAVGPVG